ncbi:hypothetical protein FJZ53_03830 [Candidatus Woesearchaeota archaeon]|nr:hypothetical protein [Candidatus Woesearchaeota archaeon]
MEMLINLAKDDVTDLKKAIEILQQVIVNKENGEYFATGLERFNVDNPRANPSKLSSPQAQKMLEQEKMMKDVDISKILERKYKRRF